VSSRVVVVTGATGPGGRATARLLTQRGDTVVAVGTDVGRLSTVHAADLFVANLADSAGAEALATHVRDTYGRADGLLHLVGGWKAGWGDEVTDWLNARLVTTLLNTSTALEPLLLAAPAGRLAIVSSTVVTRDGPPSSAYAAAKLAAESWIEQLAARWQGTEAAAVTVVVRSIGETATPASTLAEALAGLWDRRAGELDGDRILL
jgi:NAD(P)-dependent dehydrogenase (short-subunit alcohol dehydrogenase family)